MLEILYQDKFCIAVNKPAGMLVHRSFLDPYAHEFVMQTLRNQIGQHVYPVHRLDRPTSGVLLFGLNSESAKLLSEQFEQHQVQKTYLAIVRGYLHIERKKSGVIDYPLKVILDKIGDKHTLAKLENKIIATQGFPFMVSLSNHDGNRYALRNIFLTFDKLRVNGFLQTLTFQKLTHNKNKAKSTNELVEYQSAVTQWQTLATTEQPFSARPRYPTSRFSLVQLQPTTGRKHQLRRHMKHVFHPIIGDTSYGDHHQNRAIREHFDVHRLMLHAFKLRFSSLAKSEPIEVTAPLDKDWEKLMGEFGWQ